MLLWNLDCYKPVYNADYEYLVIKFGEHNIFILVIVEFGAE